VIVGEDVENAARQIRRRHRIAFHDSSLHGEARRLMTKALKLGCALQEHTRESRGATATHSIR
jgi:hypothetical protein